MRIYIIRKVCALLHTSYLSLFNYAFYVFGRIYVFNNLFHYFLWLYQTTSSFPPLSYSLSPAPLFLLTNFKLYHDILSIGWLIILGKIGLFELQGKFNKTIYFLSWLALLFSPSPCTLKPLNVLFIQIGTLFNARNL